MAEYQELLDNDVLGRQLLRTYHYVNDPALRRADGDVFEIEKRIYEYFLTQFFLRRPEGA